MRLFEHADYPFIQWRRRAYLISAALILLGIGAMIRNAVTEGSWLNYGVDFSGGTLIQLDFTRPTTVEQIRAAAAAGGATDWEITRFGGGNEFVIRTPLFQQEAGRDATARVNQVLAARYDAGDFRVVRTEAVGPRVGQELQERALLAIVVSFAATLIYLAIRFEWRFGLAAIVATAHDVLITLGYLALVRSDVSLGTVAALLTILGYSLNDTIVVFDRIRENLAKPKRSASYLQLLNDSINETLPRTVLTGTTSVATLSALYIFGGEVIQDFALVLILGIVIGTFSSIFVAAPMLYELEQRNPRYGRSTARGGAASGRVKTSTSA